MLIGTRKATRSTTLRITRLCITAQTHSKRLVMSHEADAPAEAKASTASVHPMQRFVNVPSEALQQAHVALHAYPRESVPTYSLAHQLHGDWYCYWSDDFGLPKDPDANFTFRPPLALTGAGVVVPGALAAGLLPAQDSSVQQPLQGGGEAGAVAAGAGDGSAAAAVGGGAEGNAVGSRVLDADELREYLAAQETAREAAFGLGEPLMLDGMGTEADQPIEPFVCRVPPGWETRDFAALDEEATAFFKDLLPCLGAHTEMFSSTLEAHAERFSELPADEPDLSRALDEHRLLSGVNRWNANRDKRPRPPPLRAGAHLARVLRDCAWAVFGQDQLNPVPVLALRRCGAKSRFLAGIITAVIWT